MKLLCSHESHRFAFLKMIPPPFNMTKEKGLKIYIINMKPWFFIGVCFSKFGLDLEKKTKTPC